MNDPLLRLLHDLPQATPDLSRSDRVRARCHAALAHRPRRITPYIDLADLWTPIAVGFGGLYLTEVLQRALAIYGL
jgi:hypothetical protein